MRARISYARKEYEFVVQRNPVKKLSWVDFGYLKGRAL